MLLRRLIVSIGVLVLVFFPGGYTSYQYGQVNVTNILQQYALVCGLSYICNQDLIALPFQPTFTKQYNHVCEPCSCNEDCGILGNCCPDKLLYGPKYECVNTTLVLNINSGRPEKYKMIADCPDNAELRENCVSQKYSGRDEHNKPVTSSTGITYRNQFCALCHNETDFTQWSLSIDCEIDEDMSGFNYVSSMNEMVNLGRNNSCELKYLPSGDYRMCPNKDDITVKKCNVTGKWKEFDPDINWACQNSDNKFKFFNNIFCYICNPTLEGSVVISDCNKTLSWNDYDAELLRACNEFPPHDRTYPYKNVFCFYCNRGNNDLTDVYTNVVDILGSVSVIFPNSKQFSVETKYTEINSKSIPNTAWKQHFREDGQAVNLSNILFNHILFEGTGLCNYVYLPFLMNHTLLRNCSCDATCIKQQSCCIDIPLTASDYCSSDQNLTDVAFRKDEVMYSVINDCPDIALVDDTKSLCEVDNDHNIKTKIPVISSTTNLIYKNMYCGMCHEAKLPVGFNNDDAIVSPINIPSRRIDFLPSGIFITCTPFTDFTYATELKSILYFSKRNGCIIRTMKGINSDPSKCSQSDDDLTGYCNTTGTWFDYDPDIEWVCENSSFPYLHGQGKFKNIFCEMCNPTRTAFDLIDRCNITGREQYLNPAIIHACENYPQHYATQPFKNAFCRLCNKQIKIVIENTGVDFPAGRFNFPSVVFPSYRQLFAFNSLSKLSKKDDSKTVQICREDEIYDTYLEKCLEIRCSPGKIVENDTCVPFLEKGSYLRYNLFFSMKTNLTGEVPQVYSILRHLEKEISYILSMTIRGNIQYVSYFLTTNLPCDYEIHPDIHTVIGATLSDINRTEVTVLYHSKFIITSLVDRLATEKILLNIRNGIFNVTVEDNPFTFFGVPDVKAYDIPSQAHIFKSKRMCYLFKYFPFESKILIGHVPLFEVVSEMMSCEQVQIANTYDLFTKTRQVHIAFLNKKFEVGQYRLGDNSSIYVCMDDYKMASAHYGSAVINEMDHALGILTITCTCLSLVCLLLSFVTYALFPSLRTLPGENNMCLIAALFLTQTTFQFGVSQAQTEKMCLGLGILSHYFWLTTFCCMSVCCFHMFLAFDIKFMAAYDKSDSRYLLKRYCVFSYGTPVIIILLNCGITLAVSEGMDPGYGQKRCFIIHLYAVIFTLALPLILSIAANILFFCITLKNIRSSSKIRSTKNDKRQIIIYMKLFSLTGLTWILQIVDSNVEVSAFSFLVTFLNGCQGVFIFLSYICNKRVFSLYRSLCARRRKKTHVHMHKESSETKSTITQISNLTDTKM